MMDEEIRDLYRSGYSVKEIADMLAMSEQCVLRAIKKD
jgi:transposase-like protein